VSLNGDGWTVFCCYLGTGQMEIFNAECWVISVAFRNSVVRAEGFRAQGVTTVVASRDSQPAIRQTAQQCPGTGHQHGRAINEHARACCTHGIEAAIHSTPGHLGIPGHEVADHQENTLPIDRGYTVRKRIYTSATNLVQQISEVRMVAIANWEADNCSKHYRCRLKGKARSKRSVPVTSVK